MEHTETHCHCGHKRVHSDHCVACWCEEYEATCDHVDDGTHNHDVDGCKDCED